MCRGLAERKTQEISCSRQGGGDDPGSAEGAATSSFVCCELCGMRATLYCQADDAYLCKKCDKWVHGANFLAQRHIRCLLCNTCQNLTQRYLIGASMEVVLPAMLCLTDHHHHHTSESNNNINVENQCSQSPKLPFLFL